MGKTTTAINLAASLAIAEKRVLLIDSDAQGNASSGMGVNKEVVEEKNLYRAYTGELPIGEVVVPTLLPLLEMIPANQDLIGIEVEFVQRPEREKILRTLLRSLNRTYDFIIIDCPPSLSLLTINALVASDELIVPLQCEYFALEGLGNLLNTVRLIKAGLSPTFTLGGILLTMFDSRNLLSHRVSDEVRNHFGSKVFKTIIPRNVTLSESAGHGLPTVLYDIKSRGALSYMELAHEILKNGRA